MISEARREGGGKSLGDPREESCKLRDIEDASPDSRSSHRRLVIATWNVYDEKGKHLARFLCRMACRKLESGTHALRILLRQLETPRIAAPKILAQLRKVSAKYRAGTR